MATSGATVFCAPEADLRTVAIRKQRQRSEPINATQTQHGKSAVEGSLFFMKGSATADGFRPSYWTYDRPSEDATRVSSSGNPLIAEKRTATPHALDHAQGQDRSIGFLDHHQQALSEPSSSARIDDVDADAEGYTADDSAAPGGSQVAPEADLRTIAIQRPSQKREWPANKPTAGSELERVLLVKKHDIVLNAASANAPAQDRAPQVPAKEEQLLPPPSDPVAPRDELAATIEALDAKPQPHLRRGDDLTADAPGNAAPVAQSAAGDLGTEPAQPATAGDSRLDAVHPGAGVPIPRRHVERRSKAGRRLGIVASAFIALTAGVLLILFSADRLGSDAVSKRVAEPVPARADRPGSDAVSKRVAEPVPAQENAKAPSASAGDAATSATLEALVQRGDELVITGDIAGARLYYERAAEAGSARAALRMGKTADPRFLAATGVRGWRGDPAEAAKWYRRARELGDAEAEQLLKSSGPTGSVGP